MDACVIPARGGSKRIVGKNRRPFCGTPILVRSIRVAQASELFADIVVSTDDPAIAELAVDAGASVPFVRRPELSDDHTPTNEVVADAVWQLRQQGTDPAKVCCLYATAPFVTVQDLRRGLEVFDAAEADFSFAATTYEFPVQRALVVRGDGSVEPMYPAHIGARSQDLPDAIHDAGQFYWAEADAFGRHPVVFEARAVPVMLPRARVQDIDTPEDWERAEAMFEALTKLGHV